MTQYWEDRLTPEQHEKASKALEKFRQSTKSRGAQHDLYDVLTRLGVTSEEADEIINLEIADG